LSESASLRPEDKGDMFSIKRMIWLMKENIKNSKKSKILIQDYVDMYLEGAKFFKFFGSAMAMTALGKSIDIC
jgi:hypothetical protein